MTSQFDAAPANSFTLAGLPAGARVTIRGRGELTVEVDRVGGRTDVHQVVIDPPVPSGQCELAPNSVSPVLAWHYGPTDVDSNPGKRWCYGCGGQVLVFDGTLVCARCGAHDDTEGDR